MDEKLVRDAEQWFNNAVTDLTEAAHMIAMVEEDLSQGLLIIGQILERLHAGKEPANAPSDPA